jgi:hypothetical protein
MFLAHAWRVQDQRAPQGFFLSVDKTLAWMDRGVAYVAGSFLFIAGFSLVLAHRDTSSRGPYLWLRGVLRRAGWLYLLSLLLFLPEHGVELPDMLASSGILSVIAVAVVVTATALVAPRPQIVLALVCFAVLGGTWLLERQGWNVSGMNGGPGGAIPLIAFSAFGALAAKLYLKHGTRALFATAAVASPVFLIALAQDAPWLALYPSVYQDHGGLAIAHWLGMTSPARDIVQRVFWNPSAMGALGLVFPVVTTTAVVLAWQTTLAKSWPSRPLLLLGRHALLVFVAHYGLLGLVDLAGLRPPHGGWTLVLLAALVAACTGLSAAEESRRRKRARPRSPVPLGNP